MTTSRIPILFSAWRHQIEQADHGEGDVDMLEIMAFERQISALPAKTGNDWACKIAVHAHYMRGSASSDYERSLLAQALAAMGMDRAA